MIISKEDLFSDKQEIGTTTDVVASTNVLDWRWHGDDILRNATLFVKIDGGGTPGSGTTLTVKFETSSDNSSWTELATTGALAAPAAGAVVINMALPKGLKRYNRVTYQAGTAAYSVTPTITAGIVLGGIDYAYSGVHQ